MDNVECQQGGVSKEPPWLRCRDETRTSDPLVCQEVYILIDILIRQNVWGSRPKEKCILVVHMSYHCCGTL